MKKLIITIFIAVILNCCFVSGEENSPAVEEDNSVTIMNKLYEQFDDVSETNNLSAYICKKNLDNDEVNSFLADKEGNIIFGPVLGYLRCTDSDDRYIQLNSEKAKILDGKGKPLNNFEYPGNIQKVYGDDMYVVFDSECHYRGLVNLKGDIILPMVYSDIHIEFENGFLPIEKSLEAGIHKFGFADKNYNIVAPVEYDGYLTCGDVTYLYNKTEKGFDYYKMEDNTPVYYKTLDFKAADKIYGTNDKFISLTKERTESNIYYPYYGFADKDLNIIVEPKYDKEFTFYKNYAVVLYGTTELREGGRGQDPTFVNGKYGIIDKTGNEVVKPVYDVINDFMYSDSEVKNYGNYILFKDNKKELLSLDEEMRNPDCDSWAKDSIIYAEWNELIPDEINSDFRKNITREEFCKLALQVYFKYTYSNIDSYCKVYGLDISKNPFNDTNDKSIIFAEKVGIVSGKGNGKFAPNDTITRQEAAVILVNTAKLFDGDQLYGKLLDKFSDPGKSKPFVDESYFADWAKDSIYTITTFKGKSGIPVMAGTGENKFSPWYNYSREQAIATMVRIYDIFKLNF